MNCWKGLGDRMNDSFLKCLIEEKSDIFGKMFQISATKFHYSSLDFIHQVMMTENPECIDMIMFDERTEWCDEYFLIAVLKDFCEFKEGGESLDPFTLWFIGYTYKYWMRTRNREPRDVFKILPVELFLERFAFYHTQSWEYVIQDAIEQFKQHGA